MKKCFPSPKPDFQHININQLRTTGDAAYFSDTIAKFCQGESDANENSISVPDEIPSLDIATSLPRTNPAKVPNRLTQPVYQLLLEFIEAKTIK